MKAFLTEWLVRYGMEPDNDTQWTAWGGNATELTRTLTAAQRAGYLRTVTGFRSKITSKGLEFLKDRSDKPEVSE